MGKLHILPEVKEKLIKKTITQVRKIIREKGQWAGVLVGNNVATFHILHGWHLGVEMTLTSLEELEETVSSMLYYMDKEIGNRVAFYEIEYKK